MLDVASPRSRLSKAERGPLLVPGERQAGVREQLLCRQIARLASFQDRLGDVRGEIAEADNPVSYETVGCWVLNRGSRRSALPP